jgi:hypothetical protein
MFCIIWNLNKWFFFRREGEWTGDNEDNLVAFDERGCEINVSFLDLAWKGNECAIGKDGPESEMWGKCEKLRVCVRCEKYVRKLRNLKMMWYVRNWWENVRKSNFKSRIVKNRVNFR